MDKQVKYPVTIHKARTITDQLLSKKYWISGGSGIDPVGTDNHNMYDTFSEKDEYGMPYHANTVDIETTTSATNV